MRTKNLLLGLSLCAALCISTTGCSKSSEEGASDQASQEALQQPEASAAMFQRVMSRAQALAAQQQPERAREALKPLENLKLTPQQQAQLDALKAKLPAN